MTEPARDDRGADPHPLDDEEAIRPAPVRGSRFSVLEGMCWVTLICVAMASPHWFGRHSLMMLFYGTIGAVTWRLSRFMPLYVAVFLALVFATTFTVVMLLTLND